MIQLWIQTAGATDYERPMQSTTIQSSQPSSARAHLPASGPARPAAGAVRFQTEISPATGGADQRRRVKPPRFAAYKRSMARSFIAAVAGKR